MSLEEPTPLLVSFVNHTFYEVGGPAHWILPSSLDLSDAEEEDEQSSFQGPVVCTFETHHHPFHEQSSCKDHTTVCTFETHHHPLHVQSSSCKDDTVCTFETPSPATKGYRYTEELLLPEDFQPSAYSVICGRGRDAIHSVGNRRLAVTASLFASRYAGAEKKDDKSQIVSEILDIFRVACNPHPQNAFVKYSNGRWYRVKTLHAREKIGTVLRNTLHSKYKSSTKSKVVKKRTIRRKKKLEAAGVTKEESDYS